MRPREWRKQVHAIADSMGWEVSTSRGGHLRLEKPGRRVVFTSCSSSDVRAVKNLRSQLRRAEATANA